jgi:hypothetical protein
VCSPLSLGEKFFCPFVHFISNYPLRHPDRIPFFSQWPKPFLLVSETFWAWICPVKWTRYQKWERVMFHVPCRACLCVVMVQMKYQPRWSLGIMLSQCTRYFLGASLGAVWTYALSYWRYSCTTIVFLPVEYFGHLRMRTDQCYSAPFLVSPDVNSLEEWNLLGCYVAWLL